MMAIFNEPMDLDIQSALIIIAYTHYINILLTSELNYKHGDYNKSNRLNV